MTHKSQGVQADDCRNNSVWRIFTRTYANNIKTSYTYDTTGRVSQMKFEDLNQQPPVVLDQYDYTYTGLNQQYTRTETTANVRYTYTFDKLRRLTQEKKEDLGPPVALLYQKDFTYDKAGNRTGYRHQNGAGQNYGLACNYDSWTYDAMGRLTQVRDTGRNFTATITNDWNGNITEIVETGGSGNATSTFTWDNENRLTAASLGNSGMSFELDWDGWNQAVKSRPTILGNTQNFEHFYSGSRFIGSRETTNPEQPVMGKAWQWGIGYGNGGKNEVIEKAQISSASARLYYMINDEKNTQNKSYINNAVTAGDTVDSSRNCSETQQVNGAVTPCRVAIVPNPAEMVEAYNFTLDADRAVYPYGGEGTLAILATDLEFEGSRVKSPILGRDFNPFGRGDGTYYAQGAFAIFDAKPEWIGEITTGWGNSICNGDAIPTALDLGGNASARKSRHNCDKYLRGPLGGVSDSCCGGGWSAGDDIAPGKPMPQPMASKGYASEWERETAEEQYWWCRILRDCENECHDFGNSCQCCVEVSSQEECVRRATAISGIDGCSGACDWPDARDERWKVNWGCRPGAGRDCGGQQGPGVESIRTVGPKSPVPPVQPMMPMSNDAIERKPGWVFGDEDRSQKPWYDECMETRCEIEGGPCENTTPYADIWIAAGIYCPAIPTATGAG